MSCILMPRFALAAVLSLLCSPAVSAVMIDTVSVGDPGNAGEVKGQGTFGAVNYDYRIGTYEVTNSQYAEFLNAKAASDPLALYNSVMDADIRGGITQNGSSGSFTYSVKQNMADKPVIWLSWYSALRFTNWLHNGQGNGDTETGAYLLTGGTPIPSNGNSITRIAGARWFLPSEDEWYKAAYYDPTLNGGSGGYFDYATHSDLGPTVATANSNGDISNPGTNIANYDRGADWVNPSLTTDLTRGSVTTVGSAGPMSESYYGTYDQSGNAEEFLETFSLGSSSRLVRGGSFDTGLAVDISSAFHLSLNHASTGNRTGFRVAAVVPEPSAFLLVFAAAACYKAKAYGNARRT
ncbi:Formylglycine-generating sulfatase enzyme [Posidoniimonas polymericola]|uniref:Formylglycine-generating sulfatase enzyme n=1 Tax=Posidoniimonas polymericola TaxID=2528002 RepID=A0A5C5XVH0_9BACT|nr:SUMF1/EgtB/PvdO family nonheme iron enzyme [Posidoniimonas polymericola]TWT66894.1 Formylglycine-generating sulfatase enzyme [Posidoniimonas polymericola]